CRCSAGLVPKLMLPADYVPQSYGARELLGQRVDLLFRLLGALNVPKFLGFFQFLPQLRESASIRGLGPLIEHLARIIQTADVDPRLFEILSPMWQAAWGLTGFVIIALACDSPCQ